MSLLQDAYDYVLAQLADAGITAVSDPRNVQPPCTLVDPPSIRVISPNLIETDVRINVLAPPTGTKRAVEYLLDIADTIIADTELLITAGDAGMYSIGGTDLPTYSLTARTTTRRTP